MEQTRQIEVVTLFQPSGSLDLRVDDLTSEQIATVFPRGLNEQRYTIGDDRIIQHYLEVYEFEVMIALVNVPGHDQFRPFRFLMACHHDHFDEMKRFIDHQLEIGIGSVLTGYAVIDAGSIRKYLLKELGKIGRKERDDFSIKDADALWKRQSPDMRAVIQTWMRKGVFRPERPAPHRDKIGSRLNMADLVTTGLIYGLLRRGSQRADFAETYESSPRLERETD